MAERLLTDTEATERIQGSLEQKLGYGYNVLGEVDTLLERLHWDGNLQEWQVDQDTRDYVLENEFTAACEAVDSGAQLWYNHRQWDANAGHFLAFGRPFLPMLQAGVRDIGEKIENWGVGFEFELARRKAELETERQLTEKYKEGTLQNQILLAISAYPEEADPFFAKQLGYKPEERLGKLRFEVFRNGVRQTIEVSVTGLSDDKSAALLQKLFYIGDSTNYLDKVLSVARNFDPSLGEEIFERQRWVREKGEQLVRRVYDLDFELAVSLHIGRMSRDEAFVLKKNELVRVWSIMACIINEEHAKQLFTEEEVKTIQYAVYQVQVGGYFEPRFWSYVDEMVARAQPQFVSCGGGLCLRSTRVLDNNTGNLFQMPLAEVKTTLFGEMTLNTMCPYCQTQVEAVIKHGRIHCPNCNKSAAWRKSIAA